MAMLRMRKVAALVAWTVLAGLAGVAAYEAYAVGIARAHTHAAMATVARREVRLADVPRARIAALLAVEDPGFWNHRGVDFRTPGQGLTTITQGLVKRLYFDRFRPGFAKLEQSLIARFVLHPAMSKADQLEVFLNYTYFGEADGRIVIGFPDAARTFFGKPLAGLDDRQFLALEAMTIGPNRLNPIRHPAANAERVARIQRLLAGRCRPRSVTDVTYPNCAVD